MSERRRNWKKLIISQSYKTCSDFYQSSKFRIISKKMKSLNIKMIDFSSLSKTHNKFNIISNKKYFDSYHKNYMHKKLYTNPKFFEMKRLCYTERSKKEKNIIRTNNAKTKSFLKTSKIFITNNNEINNTEKNTIEISEKNDNKKGNSLYNNIFFNKMKNRNRKLNRQFDRNYYNTNKSNLIYSNLFLPFNETKYQNSNYPDIHFPKMNDFIEDIKMVRTVKFINSIKAEKSKHENALAGLPDEKTELTIYSLTNSIRLLESFQESYINYNKFLLKEIIREKNKLDNYIADENSAQEEVLLLEKKFDDLMEEFEILTNFKYLFNSIKNKTKNFNDNFSTKSFAQITKEHLKQKIMFSRKNTYNPNITLNRKNTFLKKQTFNSKKINESTKFIRNDSISNKSLIKKIQVNRFSTSVNVNKFKENNNSKKMERLNSIQPNKFIKKNTIEILIQQNKSNTSIPGLKLDNFDVKKQFKSIENNILDSIDKYNNLQSDIKYSKLLASKENNSFDHILYDKLLKEKTNELDFCIKYNTLLISKYKLIKNKNKNYSLLLLIYNKINRFMNQVIKYRIKSYQDTIDNMRNIYDKKKLFYLYKNEKNENKRSYLIKDIINYIYISLKLIEKIQIELIQGKNNYLKNNYYSEQIVKFENKIDIDKKLFNSKTKRNEELLRRQKVNENTIKNLNKIIYKQKRKVPPKYQIHNGQKKRIIINNEENEVEDMFFY